MKNHAQKLLICFTLLITVSVSNAQWQQCAGTYGGKVNCLIANSSTVFAGTAGGGIFTTNNFTNPWNSSANGIIALPASNINSFTAISTNLFASAINSKIYRTSSNGASWSDASSNLPSNVGVNAITSLNTNLYAATGYGLYSSTNQGASWSLNSSLQTLMQSFSTSFPSAGNLLSIHVFNGVIITGTNNGYIFYSTNNGVTWQTHSTGYLYIYAITSIGNTVYITAGTGVLKSTFNGVTWTNWVPVDFGSNPTGTSVTVYSSGNTLYAGKTNGIYTVVSPGSVMTLLGLSGKRINSILKSGTTLYAGTDEGVFTSIDNGLHWKINVTGLLNNNIISFAINNGSVFATSRTGYNIYKTNNSYNWSNMNSNLPKEIYNFIAEHGGNMYVGANSGNLFVSSNSGNSWQSISNNLPAYQMAAMSFSGNNILLSTINPTSTSHPFYYSSNGGSTWAQSSGIFNGGVIPPINCIAVDGNDVFAASNWGWMYYSSDGGVSFVQRTTPSSPTPFNRQVQSMVKCGSYIFVVTVSGVYRSSNKCQTWQYVSGSILPTSAMAFTSAPIYNYGNTLYLAVKEHVYTSNDFGSTWTDISNGLLPLISIRSFICDGINLYAGTYGTSVWKMLLPPPGNPRLSSNTVIGIFPNPVQNIVTLNLGDNEYRDAVINIYNSAGARVITENQFSEIYTIDASDLKAGIYFVSIIAGDRKWTSKFVKE